MPPRTKTKATPPARPGRSEEQPADAVILLVRREEGGGASVAPQVQGDVRLTEVDSLIILGLKQWRAQAGLTVE